MSKMHVKDKLAYVKDSIINRKRYRAMKHNMNRDWYEDIKGYDYSSECDFKTNDEVGVNTMEINGVVVLSMTYAQTAMLYRFLKKCIYR